jgi:hypothetical protein
MTVKTIQGCLNSLLFKIDHLKGRIMKNNVKSILAAGLGLVTLISQAQDYRTTVMAYSTQKAPSIIYQNAGSQHTSASPEIVDYPTVSFPETDGFTAEKEKAVYHLSWQVNMREHLSYTEVQSSTDGVNFTTVGYVVNDSQKNSGFDYFVPADNNANTFRLVQHGLNAQKHISESVKIK